MDSAFLDVLVANYEWKLSLAAMVGILVVSALGGKLLSLIPAIGAAARLNADTLKQKMAKPSYAANQRWNRKWAILFQVVVFAIVMPFCLTTDPRPWWKTVFDMVVVLMVYDFFYYLTHRFLFHDSAFLGGPLKWMHAIHHRQHNPCRWDSSFIHPLEVAIGLGLYVAVLALLSIPLGKFDVVTVIVTFVAFSQINLHNHNLWTEKGFGFRYLNYASEMHHHHHAKFTGGNFATITLLYDWMFGTLDHGEGGYSGDGRKTGAKASAAAVEA